ncbi:hypothetical protein NMG60_11022707 [Bertholletia excelsa]
MGSEADQDPSSIPQLPLFTAPPPMKSPEPSWMLTPPHRAAASVPFQWEEQPGKPRPCIAMIAVSGQIQKSLDLPPRLQHFPDPKMTKIPSPTTVLDGPYVGIPVIRSSSFRFRRDRHRSFGSSCESPERGQLGEMLLGRGEKKLFGSWRRKAKRGRLRESSGSTSVLSSSMDFSELVAGGEEGGHSAESVEVSRISRNGSFSNLSHVRSPFWATIYEGFKHVLPWKSRKSKSKKDGLIV